MLLIVVLILPAAIGLIDAKQRFIYQDHALRRKSCWARHRRDGTQHRPMSRTLSQRNSVTSLSLNSTDVNGLSSRSHVSAHNSHRHEVFARRNLARKEMS